MNNQILGALGETYCEQFLYSQNMACVRPHNIDAGELLSGNKIPFGYKDGRIDMAVPEILRDDICKICRTTTKYKPRYLYDFLAARLCAESPPRQINQTKAEDFVGGGQIRKQQTQ